jgi:hypothetical protein
MLILHGSLTVLGLESSKMIAGIAGLGHMSITAAIILLFFALRAAIRREEPAAQDPVPVAA